MECPYCKQKMDLGHIHAPSSHAVYWLPEISTIEGLALSAKKIEKAGGVVIDEVTKVGFISTGKPQTYYCEKCSIFLTKLDK